MPGFSRSLLLFLCVAVLSSCGGPEQEIEARLTEHVTFLSNFEKGVDALSSKGESLAQIDGARTNRHDGGGQTDGYLEFQKDADFLGYEADVNLAYSSSSFAGGISFWLSGDPAEMTADFPEPLRIGKREGESMPWDDAVISVDFSKPPRALRFACYTDKKGERTDAETDKMLAERTIKLENISWKQDEWHHIVITWQNFNSGAPNAEWALFVDGKEVGRKTGLQQDLTWNIKDKWVRFNQHKYAGSLDDIAFFDTMLSPADAAYLYAPKKPINKLLKKDYK